MSPGHWTIGQAAWGRQHPRQSAADAASDAKRPRILIGKSRLRDDNGLVEESFRPQYTPNDDPSKGPNGMLCMDDGFVASVDRLAVNLPFGTRTRFCSRKCARKSLPSSTESSLAPVCPSGFCKSSLTPEPSVSQYHTHPLSRHLSPSPPAQEPLTSRRPNSQLATPSPTIQPKPALEQRDTRSTAPERPHPTSAAHSRQTDDLPAEIGRWRQRAEKRENGITN